MTLPDRTGRWVALALWVTMWGAGAAWCLTGLLLALGRPDQAVQIATPTVMVAVVAFLLSLGTGEKL